MITSVVEKEESAEIEEEVVGETVEVIADRETTGIMVKQDCRRDNFHRRGRAYNDVNKFNK